MTWNYRLVRHKANPDFLIEESFGIHEVYYDANDKPKLVTEDATGVVGDTIEEAASAWAMMEEAFKQPVLEYDDIGKGPAA